MRWGDVMMALGLGAWHCFTRRGDSAGGAAGEPLFVALTETTGHRLQYAFAAFLQAQSPIWRGIEYELKRDTRAAGEELADAEQAAAAAGGAVALAGGGHGR